MTHQEMSMKCEDTRQAVLVVGIMLLLSSVAYGRNILAPNEPVKVDPNSIYRTVPAPPGQPFRAAPCATNSIIEQLAHSPDGVVHLPPGDYNIPVRMF